MSPLCGENTWLARTAAMEASRDTGLVDLCGRLAALAYFFTMLHLDADSGCATSLPAMVPFTW